MDAGHKQVQVLNGGLNAAVKAGYPESAGDEVPAVVGPYEVKGWLWPQADMQEVENVSGSTDFVVIDVRDKERYDGDKEPIDLVAGHIPGAVNVPFTGNLDADGFYFSPEILRRKYEEVLQSRPVENTIVHCGSGVTACHTLLALAYAGLGIPKLYVGSWSEWSRNNKIITTKNNNS